MNNKAMEQIETASVDELRGLQLERMKKTLQHAYQNSTVYKKKFDEAGVHPDDLKSLDDLAKFPFIFINIQNTGISSIWKYRYRNL